MNIRVGVSSIDTDLKVDTELDYLQNASGELKKHFQDGIPK